MLAPAAPAAYTRTAVVLHWAVAALIVIGFVMGQVMTDLAMSPLKLRLYSWHKWLGITVLMLVVLRLIWRLTHRPPAPPPMPAWQRKAARATHALLYVLMLAIPLSGWLFSSAAGVPTVLYGLWQLPDLVARDETLADRLRFIHVALNNGLLALVLLHVAAAVKHQFIDRDGLMARMGRAAFQTRTKGPLP